LLDLTLGNRFETPRPEIKKKGMILDVFHSGGSKRNMNSSLARKNFDSKGNKVIQMFDV